MNKKGSVRDILVVLTLLFVFGFVTILMAGVYNEYIDSIDDNQAFNNTVNNAVEERTENLFLTFDYIYVFVLLSLIMLVVASSFYIRTHPVFFFVSLLFLIVMVVLGAVFSDVFDTAMDAPILAEQASNYNIITWVMEHFPSIILLVGGGLLAILYAKNRMEE